MPGGVFSIHAGQPGQFTDWKCGSHVWSNSPIRKIFIKGNRRIGTRLVTEGEICYPRAHIHPGIIRPFFSVTVGYDSVFSTLISSGVFVIPTVNCYHCHGLARQARWRASPCNLSNPHLSTQIGMNTEITHSHQLKITNVIPVTIQSRLEKIILELMKMIFDLVDLSRKYCMRAWVIENILTTMKNGLTKAILGWIL